MRRAPRTSVRGKQNLVLFLPLLALLVVRVVMRSRDPVTPWDLGMDAAGVVCLGLGLWIRICARQWKAEQAHDGLVSDGLYGAMRHPLYVGSFLLGAGLCLILSDPILLGAFTLLFWLSHGRVIRHEEADLERIFGEAYREYRQRVPAFIPRVSALRQRIVPRRFREGIVREVDPVCISPAVLVVVDLAIWAFGGPRNHPLQVGYGLPPGVLVALLAGLALLWLRLKREYRVLIQRERRHRLEAVQAAH